ncbi:plastocyanin/azurin family copper-binding protein [Halosegnis sp.]|uniref:plastocyanin/azurin family copper-binding protein n=1 Tax=Halosegnis sp. TaxID=2864959 RepID=UPI0035D4160C
MSETPTRRRLLYLSGIAGVTALAGCAGGSSSTATPADGSDETATPTQTSGGDGEWTAASTVEMTNSLKFAPKRIQVEQGTTVTFKNVGSVAHSVTAYEDNIPDGAAYFASGGFDSQSAAEEGYPDKGRITEGGTYEHTFETTGEYKYYCIPHEMNGMVGYVKVV